jgi:hypothetical protein
MIEAELPGGVRINRSGSLPQLLHRRCLLILNLFQALALGLRKHGQG